MKGIFIVYDIFSKSDCVIEINIPGNLRIYKVHNQKKELISNEEINFMYISAIIRAMYERNMSWGKSYSLFRSEKSVVEEFKTFLAVFLKIVEKNDIYISDDFENKSSIKGSHLCSILLRYVK